MQYIYDVAIMLCSVYPGRGGEGGGGGGGGLWLQFLLSSMLSCMDAQGQNHTTNPNWMPIVNHIWWYDSWQKQ